MVKKLGAKSKTEWSSITKNTDFPIELPKSPSTYYKNRGWNGWGDWLGTNTIAPQNKKFMTFNNARIFIRSLNLKNIQEFKDFCLPNNIPNAPGVVYKDKGWLGWIDFLGNETRINPSRKDFYSFKTAKNKVCRMKIGSVNEWKKYCLNKTKDPMLPSHPERIYKDEWKGWADFLGKSQNNSK